MNCTQRLWLVVGTSVVVVVGVAVLSPKLAAGAAGGAALGVGGVLTKYALLTFVP